MAKRGKAQRKAQSQAWKIGSAILFGAVLVLCLLDRAGIYTRRDWERLFGGAQPVKAECAVHFVDVGQGDCVYIHSGESDVLIDAGEAEYGDAVVQYLEEQGVSSLDYVISTHPHSDHVGGLAAVIRMIPTEHVLVSDIPEDDLPTTRAYENFLLAVDDAGLSLTIAKSGDVYALGDAVLSVLGPLGSEYESMNNYSVVTCSRTGTTPFC